MIKSRKVASAIFFLALSVSWESPVSVQLTKINVGYSAISGDDEVSKMAECGKLT